MTGSVDRQIHAQGSTASNRISKTKWLFTLFWIQYTVIYWSCVILNKLPFFIYITPLVFPMLLIVALFVWLTETNYKMDIWNIPILVAAFAFWFISRQMHPEYLTFFNQNEQRCLEAFLMIYVGKSVFRGGVDETYYALLIKMSQLGVAFTALYFAYGAMTGRIVESEYMTISYRMLPSTLCVTSAFLKQVNIRNAFWFIFSVLLQFFMGTRGAILAIAVFLVLYVLLFAKRKTFFVVLGSAGVFLILDRIFGIVELLLIGVSKLCLALNMSPRIFEAILSNNLTDDNGREAISEFIIGKMGNNIWSGQGIFADRHLLRLFSGDVPYVHNIFLELWLNFGLVACIAILLLILILTLRKLLNRKLSEQARLILAITFSAAMTQLLFTGSYLTDGVFWLFLGVLWGMYRYMKVTK